MLIELAAVIDTHTHTHINSEYTGGKWVKVGRKGGESGWLGLLAKCLALDAVASRPGLGPMRSSGQLIDLFIKFIVCLGIRVYIYVYAYLSPSLSLPVLPSLSLSLS